MNLTNFKVFDLPLTPDSDIKSLHIDRSHIVAIEETQFGTRIYASGGHVFHVNEGVGSVREHLYAEDFWPKQYAPKEPTFVRRRKPYTTDEYEYVQV